MILSWAHDGQHQGLANSLLGKALWFMWDRCQIRDHGAQGFPNVLQRPKLMVRILMHIQVIPNEPCGGIKTKLFHEMTLISIRGKTIKKSEGYVGRIFGKRFRCSFPDCVRGFFRKSPAR